MLSRTHYFILAVSILVLGGFGIFYLQSSNYEFMAYVVLAVGVLGTLYGTLSYTRFPTYLLVWMTLWLLMHMMGGSIMTSDGVLYAYKLLPLYDGGGEFYVLKFDQFVHAFLYGCVGLMVLHLIRNVISLRTHITLIALLAILAATGISVLNEIVEFTAAVTLPQTGVGGYENTMLDLVFNLFGAALAVVVAILLERR